MDSSPETLGITTVAETSDNKLAPFLLAVLLCLYVIGYAWIYGHVGF